MKKMFAIVLALMLCVSILSVASFAAEGDMVVHIQAPEAWEKCYAYNWPESLGGWPGTELSADADGLYTLTLSGTFDGMVIGAGDGQPQTVDITDLDLTAGEAWITIGDAGSDGKHTYTISYTAPGEGGNEGGNENEGGNTNEGGNENEGGNTNEPAPTGNYYVAGVGALCGSEWKENDPANKMTYADGVYSITYKNVAAGKYSLKVTDGTWTNSWGGNGENGNFDFEVKEAGDITVQFNANNKQVSIVVGDETLKGPATGDMSLAGVSIALLAATAGLVAVVSKKKEF